jgi:hypothetical protein
MFSKFYHIILIAIVGLAVYLVATSVPGMLTPREKYQDTGAEDESRDTDNPMPLTQDAPREVSSGPHGAASVHDPTTLSGPGGPGDAQSQMLQQQQGELKPEDLLPKDMNTKWAQANPTGQGMLSDRNFLDAGHHVGVNTVGQTLRNANYNVRSEPPCPQMKVSPWMQSTIDPDIGRKPLEIGSGW